MIPLCGQADRGQDLVREYVATQCLWREISAPGSTAAMVDRMHAAREYVRAIDAYLVTLKACGRRIPYRLDVVADALRAEYGEAPLAAA
jgi:hypothetical protein